MTTHTLKPLPSRASAPWRALLSRWREASPPLFWVGVAMLVLSLPTVLLAGLDPRTLHGVSVWTKPWKFQVSIGTYLLTLGLFMVWLPAAARQGWTGRGLVWVAVVCGCFELGYITWQAAWGQASHFNFSSATSTLMYSLMGVGAVLLTGASLALAILFMRHPAEGLPEPMRLSLVLGLLGTFVLGTGFGAYLSAQPTGHWVTPGMANGTTGATNLAALAAAGLSDAGGWPVFKWSRSVGDLRVAHFFGIHTMHALALFGGLLAWRRVPKAMARASVWAFALGYTAWCVWTFVQAANGQAFGVPGGPGG